MYSDVEDAAGITWPKSIAVQEVKLLTSKSLLIKSKPIYITQF